MNEPTRIRKLQLLSHQFMICEYFLFFFFNELIWLLYLNRSRVSKIQFLIHVMVNGTGFVKIVLNSRKTLEMCPAIFQTWKNPKNGKKSWVYFLSKLQHNCFINEFFLFWSNLNQSRMDTCSASWKKLCFCIFGVSIEHLFDNLESGKRNPTLLILLLFWKNVWTEKVMNFGSKNLYKPCSNTAYLKYDSQTSWSEKKEMINSWKRSWLLNKFSSSVLWEKYGRQSWWCLGFEGLTHYIFHFTCWWHQLVKWRF